MAELDANIKKQEATYMAKYNFKEVVETLIKIEGEFTANHVFDLLKVEPTYTRSTVNFNNMKRSLDKEFNLEGYELLRKGNGLFSVRPLAVPCSKRIPSKPQINQAFEDALPIPKINMYTTPESIEATIGEEESRSCQDYLKVKLGGPPPPHVNREVIKAMMHDIKGDAGLMEAFNMFVGATYGFKAVPVTTWELVEL